MFQTISPTFLLQESHNYSPEDLEAMRQAFMRACGENPLAAATEAQRSKLAKAVISFYQRQLTQTQLIAAAMHAMAENSTGDVHGS